MTASIHPNSPGKPGIHRPLLSVPSRLDRYLLTEMIAPFIFGFGLFTAIAAVIGTVFYLIRLMVDRQLPLFTAIEVFFLRLPTFAVLGVPMAVLFCSLIAYSRLSRRSEIIACKSCGIGPQRLVVPALLGGVLALLLTLLLSEAISPALSYRGHLILATHLDESALPYRSANIFYRQFQDHRLAQIFFAHTFDGEAMGDVTVLNFDQGQLQEMILADTALWNDTDQAWDFRQGSIYQVNPDQSYRTVRPFSLEQFDYSRTPLDLAWETRVPEHMNSQDMRHYIKILRQSGDQRQVRHWQVQLQDKSSLPLVCLSFALIGSVLGINSPRSNRSRAFGLSVVIIFGYYVFAFICTAFGEGGMITPIMAGWLPKGILTLLGLGLLYQASRQ